MRPLRLLPAALLLAAAAPAAAPAADPPATRDQLKALERQTLRAAAAAEPAVVCVVVSHSELYPPLPAAEAGRPGRLGGFDPKPLLASPDPVKQKLGRRLDLSDPRTTPDHGYAGGVVIDAAGLVLTPYHVIDGATKIYVRFVGGHGSYADVRAADARSDLAVLTLLDPPPGLKPLAFGDVRTADRIDGPKANVAPGRLVIAAANPFATDFRDGTLTTSLGAVSFVGRRSQAVPAASEPGIDPKQRRVYDFGTLMRCDVRLNPELSGAAILNTDGELIGLTTTAAAVAGGENAPGFVLPLDENTQRIVDVLRRGEEVEYGFLGVTHVPPLPGPGMRPLPAAGAGSVFVTVLPGGPADAAGVGVRDTRPFAPSGVARDVITAVDGHRVTTFDDLLLHVGSARAGSTVRLTVPREGGPREIPVTLGKFVHTLPTVVTVRPEPVFGLRVDYATVLAHQNSAGVPPGVAFREAVPGSPAAARFKPLLDQSKEWVVTAVNGAAVNTPAEFYRAARGKPSVRLTVADPAAPVVKREISLP